MDRCYLKNLSIGIPPDTDSEPYTQFVNALLSILLFLYVVALNGFA